MALLLRFSSAKLGEGRSGGRKPDLSLDISMVETDVKQEPKSAASPTEEGGMLPPMFKQSLAI